MNIVSLSVSLLLTTSLFSQTILFSDTFQTASSLNDYTVDFDLSTGVICDDIFPDVLDYDVEHVTETGNGYLSMLTNSNGVGGMKVPLIVHRDLPQFENGTYTFSGRFRKDPSSTGPGIEHVDINISLVEDSVEHYAEIFWTLNQWDSKYGVVWTRNALCDVNDPNCVDSGGVIPLDTIPEDNAWHTFEIVVDYTPVNRKIQSISVDNQQHLIDLEMGVNPVKKEWPYHFKVLCETQNTNTNCDTNNVFIGHSNWDDLTVSYQQNDVSINELDQPSIELYPNPARDIITLSGTDAIDELILYDGNGKKVAHYTENNLQYDVSELALGIYDVHVILGEITVRKKLVIH